tara:strand:- start:54 stop:254 length:201 start_codon:yes stop_codon:yes gene_type:complete
VIVGKLINAIKIGDVIMPMIANNILIMPAAYSLLKHASKPKMRAIGLNNGDRMNIPMKPKMIPSVP